MLFVAKESSGPQSVEVESSSKAFVKECNVMAMSAVANGQTLLGYEFLQKALTITELQTHIADTQQRMELQASDFVNYLRCLMLQ